MNGHFHLASLEPSALHRPRDGSLGVRRQLRVPSVPRFDPVDDVTGTPIQSPALALEFNGLGSLPRCATVRRTPATAHPLDPRRCRSEELSFLGSTRRGAAGDFTK